MITAEDAHRTYNLETIGNHSVTIVCAGCHEPLGVALIDYWGQVAEAHYREKVKNGG